MKKVIFTLPILFSLAVAAGGQNANECIETFQKEIRHIVYANQQENNGSLESLTAKINQLLEKECDINLSLVKKDELNTTKDQKVLVIDTQPTNGDCIENFSNEIKEMLYDTTKSPGITKEVKVVIKGNESNCTDEVKKN